MSDVIIFGGTTEGRRLAEFCGEHKIQTVVCVVSEYGEMLVPESPSVRVIRRALEKDEMEALLWQKSLLWYWMPLTHMRGWSRKM